VSLHFVLSVITFCSEKNLFYIVTESLSMTAMTLTIIMMMTNKKTIILS